MGLLLLFLLVACKPALPPGVLSESEMEAVLYDYHVALAMAETSNGDYRVDERRFELQSAVYRKHDITEAEFDSSMVYYSSDLEKLNRIYSHLNKRLEREAEAIGANTSSDIYADLTSEGDTANVWMGRPLYVVKNKMQENLQMWSQTCDSTWLMGDDVLLRFTPTTFTRDNLDAMFVTLVVVYTNDSIRGKTLTLTHRQTPEILISDTEGWTPRTVSGQFYTPAKDDPQQAMISVINNFSLIRFHKSQEWRAEKLQALSSDSVSVDSLALDTLVSAPVSRADSLHHRPAADENRLSPSELRDQQTVDRKINVVKEKPYQPVRRNNNRRGTNNRRR